MRQTQNTHRISDECFFFEMENKISYQADGRYFANGSNSAKKLLLCLHGYGHLGEYFLSQFDHLHADEYFIVVPEAPHRFYLNGTGGKVGASWLTKETREADITNYIRMLNSVMSDVLMRRSFEKKILLGFSQGGATASRFFTLGDTLFDALILWGTVFPADMELTAHEMLSKSKNYFVVGNQDKYYKSGEITIDREKFSESGTKFGLITFDGAHELHNHTLNQLLHEI